MAGLGDNLGAQAMTRDPVAMAQRVRARAESTRVDMVPLPHGSAVGPGVTPAAAGDRHLAKVDQSAFDRLAKMHANWVNGRSGGKPLRLIAHDLSGLNLSDLDLTDCDLSGCSLRASTCQRTNFKRATLRGVDFDDADLGGAVFERADMRQIRLATVKMISIGDERTSFREAQLTGSRLTRACMQGVDFTGAVLTNATLDDADIRGAVFVGADLTGAELRGSLTAASDFRGVTGLPPAQRELMEKRGARMAQRIDPADPAFRRQLVDHRRWIDTDGTEGSQLALEGCDLSRGDFSGVLFAAARLRYCSFAFSNLTGAVMAGADIAFANFRGANLVRTDFRGVDTKNTIMAGATTVGMLTGALPSGKLRRSLGV